MARRLKGELFWGDRWMSSDAFLLPLEARGLYREMLTQSWMRDGSLPKEPESIRRACGVTVPEWRRCWPRIRKYWTSEGDRIFNRTQREVLAASKALGKARANAGAKGRASQLANAGPLDQSPDQGQKGSDQEGFAQEGLDRSDVENLLLSMKPRKPLLRHTHYLLALEKASLLTDEQVTGYMDCAGPGWLYSQIHPLGFNELVRRVTDGGAKARNLTAYARKSLATAWAEHLEGVA